MAAIVRLVFKFFTAARINASTVLVVPVGEQVSGAGLTEEVIEDAVEESPRT